MERERIKYKDVMNLGFIEEIQHDPVYMDEYGFDWAIVTLDLTKKIYLDWDKLTGYCDIIRIDSHKTGNILNKRPIKNLKQLEDIVDFFKNNREVYEE